MAPARRTSRRPTIIRPSPLRRSDLRQVPERLVHLLRRVLVVLELAGEERLVAREVEMAVAAQVEDDRLPLAVSLAPERLLDAAAHRVSRLGPPQDPLRARELPGGMAGPHRGHGGRPE